MGEYSIRRDIKFAKKDEPLKHDVKRLGAMIGDLLKEQGGSDLFERVERARRLAIEHRESDHSTEAELLSVLRGLEPDLAREMVRAFSMYFELVNTAEKVHRIRRRRDYLRDLDTRQPLGLDAALATLKEQGLDREAVEGMLNAIEIMPVFTAHPTEPTRRTILRKEQNIVRLLVAMLDTSMTPHERLAYKANIRAEITTIWQTEENPVEGMSVADELEHILFFMTDVLYRVIPPLYENIEHSIAELFNEPHRRAKIDSLVRFGSWVGGDMDGNPNVTSKTIRSTLARQRSLVLNLYFEECSALAAKLSQTVNRVGISRRMDDRINEYKNHFPDAMHAVPARHRDMRYRVFLRLIQARLQSTYDDSAFPYDEVAEFEADIELIETSLANNRGENAGLFAVQRLLRRVRTFGFHFMTLDVRQNALSHRQVIGAGLGDDDWMERSPEYRAEKICEALATREPPIDPGDTRIRKTLNVFQSIVFCKRKYGPRAIGLYVVSMCRAPDDVLSVLLLAQWGDLMSRKGVVRLDIAPLLETVNDLQNGAAIMRSLLSNPVYSRHLDTRERHQTIMVGYSDSNKDGGFGSARWALHDAQTKLVCDLEDQNIKITLFHGRGGTISRGGGNAQTAILGAPPNTVNGRLRVTEQGEIINEKYGLRGIALRNMEQVLGAVVLAGSEGTADDVPAAWSAFMETMANASREKYRSLVYDDPQFYEYFRLATPIDVIEQMQIGSRPASRGQKSGIGDLRAIPWVFSWTQSRFGLTGWFGVGSGLQAAIDEHGSEVFTAMLSSWHFASGLIGDVETVMAKSDLRISNHYSKLAGELHSQFFPVIQQEFDLTKQLVLSHFGHEKLLDSDRTLQRAIRLRNPYLDPVSFLQVDLLERWRASDRSDDTLRDALFAAVNGIARGLQNTG